MITQVSETVSVTVDGRAVQVRPGTLVLDAATEAGVHIPIYCAHSKMDPVAVCRMCLVEIEKLPKLMPACATVVTPDMVIHTASEKVVKVREGVLEFLLENHPLDCPVCDRGGECDLQDFAFRYGPTTSRFPIVDKVHSDKAVKLSELIELDRERCILCWRCVRYYDEITGEQELVLDRRGVDTVIATFANRELTSAFQGNLPEVCPVGALTHRQYRFKARPWDLQRSSGVCPECSYGCNIHVDTRNFEVVRFASRDNPSVDDMWLCDRGRYSATSWNGGARISSSHIRKGGSVAVVPFSEALEQAAAAIARVTAKHGADAIGVLVSPRLTNEELWLAQLLGREVIGTQHVDVGAAFASGAQPGDSGLALEDIEACSDVVVVGTEPEAYSPVLTLRLFKAARKHGVRVRRVAWGNGESAGVLTREVLAGLADGRDGSPVRVGVVAAESDAGAARDLRDALLAKGHSASILSVVHGVNGRGARDLGLVDGGAPGYAGGQGHGNPGGTGSPVSRMTLVDQVLAGGLKGLLVLDGAGLPLAADVTAALAPRLRKLDFMLAIESVSGIFSDSASILIPGHAYFEKGGTVTSSEGRVQRIRPALPSSGDTPRELLLLQKLATLLGATWEQMDEIAVFRRLADRIPAYAAAGYGGRTRWMS